MSERTLPSRRDFLALAGGAFAVAALPLAAFRRRGAGGLVRRSVPSMGGMADLAAVHPDRRRAGRALDAAIAELRRVEAAMTRFDPASDVGRANRLAYADAVPVGDETAAVLREALRWSAATDGGFDPTLARVADLWDVKRRHAPPPGDAVRRMAGRRLWRTLDVDVFRGRPVVRFGDRDVQLDLGGIACGYGVDRAVAAMRAWGVFDGFVNVGGDIYALGVREDGEPWEVGVRSPYDPDALVGTARLSDRAIATSGDYEQYFDYGGRRYSHILDPATAEPRRSATHGVTIAAATCLATDAASTACFGLAPEAVRALLARAAPGAELVSLA